MIFIHHTEKDMHISKKLTRRNLNVGRNLLLNKIHLTIALSLSSHFPNTIYIKYYLKNDVKISDGYRGPNPDYVDDLNVTVPVCDPSIRRLTLINSLDHLFNHRFWIFV
uniref:Uncharacterized protein n=1 Tax=Homalodisca liturata TaxID=320908 RepID=A0A1B6HE18_9HEMI